MTVKLLILFVVILGVTSHPINLNQTSVEESSGELQLLQIITRHGDRTPYWIYKVQYILFKKSVSKIDFYLCRMIGTKKTNFGKELDSW